MTQIGRGDTMDRKCQIDLLIYVGGTLVTCGSKKQVAVAHFSTEAEYRAIATTVEELEAVKALLTELGIQFNNHWSCIAIT